MITGYVHPPRSEIAKVLLANIEKKNNVVSLCFTHLSHDVWQFVCLSLSLAQSAGLQNTQMASPQKDNTPLTSV